MEHRHSILKSFMYALNGLKGIILQERNFKIQLFVASITVGLGFILKLDITEWLDLVIVITLVLIFELINTSIEEMVDIVSPEVQEKARIAKDVAAGTVLVAALGSVIVGVLLFVPKILILLK